MVQVEIVNTGICEKQSPEYMAMVKQFNNDIVAEYFKERNQTISVLEKIIVAKFEAQLEIL